MVIDVNQTQCGNHFSVYENIESPRGTPESNRPNISQ